MAQLHRRDPSKEQFWRTQLQRQAQSGLSVRDFCKRHKLTEANFYAWRRQIAQRDSEVPPQNQHLPDFLPIQLLSDASQQAPCIEVRLRTGDTLKLPQAVDLQLLTALLAALEGRA